MLPLPPAPLAEDYDLLHRTSTAKSTSISNVLCGSPYRSHALRIPTAEGQHPWRFKSPLQERMGDGQGWRFAGTPGGDPGFYTPTARMLRFVVPRKACEGVWVQTGAIPGWILSNSLATDTDFLAVRWGRHTPVHGVR